MLCVVCLIFAGLDYSHLSAPFPSLQELPRAIETSIKYTRAAGFIGPWGPDVRKVWLHAPPHPHPPLQIRFCLFLRGRGCVCGGGGAARGFVHVSVKRVTLVAGHGGLSGCTAVCGRRVNRCVVVPPVHCLRAQGFDRYLARDYDGAALWYLKAWWLGYEVGPANAAYLVDKDLASVRTLQRVVFGERECTCIVCE